MIRNPQSLKNLIDSKLEEQSYGDSPVELYEPIRYIMDLGGKRLRPLLTLLSYQLYEEDAAEVLEEALSIELFHNFTLVHDDIMDNAPLRRGQQTVHEKWNDNVAILSGDVMLVRAYDFLLHNRPDNAVEIVKRFNQTAAEVCEGQQFDMNFETRKDVTEEEYLEMIRLKTAVLLGLALELGAMLANAGEEDIDHLRKMGECAGLGFQLKDDLLDVFADDEKFGKQVGGDIIARKKTFLTIRALQLAKGKDKKELESLYSEDSKINPEERVKRVTELYQKYGIRELTEEKMNDYFDQAFFHLKKVNTPLNRKAILRGFTEALIDRES